MGVEGETGSRWHRSAQEGAASVAPDADVRFAALFRHGTLLVEYYAPRGVDRQKPHARDEVYVVAQGSAVYFDGATRRPCAPGDLIFVAAGLPHRFEQISPDFGTWVMFYGPEGGEAAT